MRHIFVLRHAKSSWEDPALRDHDRPLAPRGHRAAELMAGYLREQRLRPALVLCSTARRARETLERIRPGLAEDTEVRLERDLYEASADDLLERVRILPEALPSAMLIGHNPGIADLARTLAASGPELVRLERKFPTGALATLALPTSWREVGPGAAVLESFVRPKGLE